MAVQLAGAGRGTATPLDPAVRRIHATIAPRQGTTHKMLAPLELIAAYPWRRTTYTTYALSLSFFEAVILDALVRGGGRETLILADVAGVQAALGEQGARRVGKDYDLEPIAVGTGVFHPKISALIADDECHLLIGSGNLTFGGWGGNLEVIEHLHPSFAADAIDDAADFFERLSLATHVRHGAGERFNIISDDLRAAIRGRSRNGNIRLFHSLDGSISQKLVGTVDELGGAVRLVTAAPFWDDGSAIDDLCSALDLEEVFVHVHVGGTVEGNAGSNWPVKTSSTVYPVQLNVMHEKKPRRLHAKAFEVICKRGRILLSGSANATAAALGSKGNVEACIARIQRQNQAGWTFSAADLPKLRLATDEDDDEESDAVGILRAILNGDRISGQVITPKMSGVVSIFQITTEGPIELGKTTLGPNALFSFKAPGLEMQWWKGDRLVLQVQSADDRRSEGFISVAAFAEITRRAGAVAPRLFAILAGTETPADVAAIMSWFHEDPRRLSGAAQTRIGGGGGPDDDEDDISARTVSVAELNSSFAVRSGSGIGSEPSEGASWRRFMENVFSAFREKRGPFGRTGTGRKGDDDDDDGDDEGGSDSGETDPEVLRSLETFGKLFELLLSSGNITRHALLAFDLTQYICERLQPDFEIARIWLERLVDTLANGLVPAERREEVAAAILALLACGHPIVGARNARARLLRLGYTVSGDAPQQERAHGFQSVLIQTVGWAEIWEEIQAVRTFHEQVQSYLLALKTGQRSQDYDDLRAAAPEEWPVLQAALDSPASHNGILIFDKWVDSCPLHHMTFPLNEISKLRTIGIATAKYCCSRVLIYPGV